MLHIGREPPVCITDGSARTVADLCLAGRACHRSTDVSRDHTTCSTRASDFSSGVRVAYHPPLGQVGGVGPPPPADSAAAKASAFRQFFLSILTGRVPCRQADNWARGRSLASQLAALLAVALQDFSPEALMISLEEAEFSWHEILGVLPPCRHGAGAASDPTQDGRLRYHASQARHEHRADDPYQCRIRNGAERHVSEKVTESLNAKGTYWSAQGRSTKGDEHRNGAPGHRP